MSTIVNESEKGHVYYQIEFRSGGSSYWDALVGRHDESDAFLKHMNSSSYVPVFYVNETEAVFDMGKLSSSELVGSAQGYSYRVTRVFVMPAVEVCRA